MPLIVIAAGSTQRFGPGEYLLASSPIASCSGDEYIAGHLTVPSLCILSPFTAFIPFSPQLPRILPALVSQLDFVNAFPSSPIYGAPGVGFKWYPCKKSTSTRTASHCTLRP